MGTLLLLQYLAVTILAEDDPSREPGIDDRKRVAVGDQILNEELLTSLRLNFSHY